MTDQKETEAPPPVLPANDIAVDAAKPASARRPLRRHYEKHRTLLRRMILVVATALSLFGTLGQFLFVESVEDVAKARAEEMRSIESRTETLRTAQSAYFNAQVQANMLFALNPADRSVNMGIVGDLYKLAMHDRAFPFRLILGELAIAGALDFRTVNAQYNELREKAQADLDYESFSAVGAFENKVIDDAMALHGALQDRFWKAQEEKAAADAKADARRAGLIALAGLATCLFLLANLMGVKD